jgi:hypothetical protein
MNMDEIETMLAPEGQLNLAEGQEHADTISIMLMAFPHMFPATTNQWVAGADRDAALDTYASPACGAGLPISIGGRRPHRRLPSRPVGPGAPTASRLHRRAASGLQFVPCGLSEN